jgi:hypothetical protein
VPVLSHDRITLTIAFLVGVIAVARFTRLVVHDDWPPMVWLRQKYRHAVNYGSWEALVTCPFCFAPWPALADLAWGWGSDLHWSWWAANLWFAGAYLASMLVVRDEPPEE